MDTDYWYIGSVDGGYKVDKANYQAIKEAIRTDQRWIDFKDIFGTSCGLTIKFITDWHHSTLEARQKHNDFQKMLEKEKEKPEWDQ